MLSRQRWPLSVIPRLFYKMQSNRGQQENISYISSFEKEHGFHKIIGMNEVSHKSKGKLLISGTSDCTIIHNFQFINVELFNIILHWNITHGISKPCAELYHHRKEFCCHWESKQKHNRCPIITWHSFLQLYQSADQFFTVSLNSFQTDSRCSE